MKGSLCSTVGLHGGTQQVSSAAGCIGHINSHKGVMRPCQKDVASLLCLLLF